MTKNDFKPTLISNPPLKDYVMQMESTLKQLDSAVGGHMNALNKTLNKINGRGIRKNPQSNLSRYAHSPLSLSGILSSFVGSVGNVLGRQAASGGDMGMSSDSGYSQMSQGQIWAEAASAISRAIKRDL